ncbi:cytochrome c oxidase accessory protein CcoG [Algoriphagus halophytocola]|uniref:Cytochrome c oxidase accessory protein CcoG n=1 Tax=Algoriphagus halophytocola TaxID=2991499 RepID=A0ABY6MHT8_9BACT|nr:MULTISPECIES: cytochrome c oxidase accessory protein CcoG [unclassified Algoriphagus]UZD22544.1 cytochrome c oxidase accessory protein CcoG [Algoriphagus sp. TR-M5]WBL43807.1 cytochrome c oxidase accessory protein CcoG [Algoriphagus sp. TR-M9]
MAKKNPHLDPEHFRDALATVQDDGKRNWVYPKKVKGFFYKNRTYLSWVLLAILFAGPFIQVDGRPYFLFNIFERKFIIFGAVFWPQDTYLLIFLLLIFFLFIILFTVAFGRVWCGWACPQTLFMEMVFRKIEYAIEGDANQQRALNAKPWDTEKVIKKGSKIAIFAFISLLIGHLVMAYLIGINQVITIVSSPPSAHMSGFLGLLGFSGIFMFVFTWFREQACLVVCPYGRLQGVLLDDNSINVMYDYVRGEPRGPIRKNPEENSDKGDCVDCSLCVQVCPTGIDIRNGIQMECVNCTACIDACDEVMEKVDRPKGLIRYASPTSIKQGFEKLVTGRVKVYIVILTLLVSAFVSLIVTREDIAATITRFPGMTYQEREDGTVSNLYQITLINKTFEQQEVELKSVNEGLEVEILGAQTFVLEPQSKFEGRFFLVKNNQEVRVNQEKVALSLMHLGEEIDQIETSFTAPVSN